MKVLRWRMRAFEGEVIGKEFKGNEKINIMVPPLADKSFVSSLWIRESWLLTCNL
jgi:hypothetical protein